MDWVVSERILFSLVLLWVIRSPVLSKPIATLFLLDVFVGCVYPLFHHGAYKFHASNAALVPGQRSFE